MRTALFDTLIASPGRLKILTALVADPSAKLDFVNLRSRTGLTDGNLATHTRRLEAAGLVQVNKTFQDRKPITHVQLMPPGRSALEQHARELTEALYGLRQTGEEAHGAALESVKAEERDDWVD